MMVYEYGYEHGYEKERLRELNHRQKVRFSTLLLPVLVTWTPLTLEAELLPIITLNSR